MMLNGFGGDGDGHRCYARRTVNLLAALLAISALSSAKADQAIIPSRPAISLLAPDDVRMVAPALEKYTQERLLGELWHRPGLSPRDRSIITVSALIARNQTIEMPFYLNLALDNGVKSRELSEIITHLAFYSGWANAMSAVVVAKDIFAQRGIGSDQLPASSPELLPLNPSAEAQRATSVDQQLGSGFPGLVQYTTDVLFRDLWLRPDLSPRDRSLVTVSALIASGQFAQLPGHLNRAMNNGLTHTQAGEMVTHLAFYAGWPNAFTAAPIVKTAFEKRSN
jgi:4-carboxymuconolactone decarboxylase